MDFGRLKPWKPLYFTLSENCPNQNTPIDSGEEPLFFFSHKGTKFTKESKIPIVSSCSSCLGAKQMEHHLGKNALGVRILTSEQPAFVRKDTRSTGEMRYPFFSIFAHESRREAVRLNTNLPGFESAESTQKYPIRSNW